MFGPERKWWFCIILASVFLLFAKSIHATQLDNDVPNTTPQLTDVKDIDNFETIDVAQQQREGNNNVESETGQTTRIAISGEVDNNFWLKHLGEDFKYAIHLQVGDNSYNGIYNMTEDGSNYDIKNDYGINEVPVDENRSESQKKQNNEHDIHVSRTNTKETNSDNKSNDNFTTDQTKVEFKDYEDYYANAERNRPLVKKESAIKKQNQMKQYTKYTKPTKIKNINNKYAHKQHKHEKSTLQKQHKQEKQNNAPEKDSDKATSYDSWKSQTSPVVVTLPDKEKTIYHLANDEEPVVVKMPPVIYHQDPTYSEYTSEESPMNDTTNLQHSEQTIPTHNQYTSHQTQQSLQYENTDFTQYNLQHSIHSPHISPMMPLLSSQYYNHNRAMMNEPSVYHSESVYTSFPPLKANSNPIQSPKEEHEKSTDSVHFILRKPSIPYNGHTSHNEIAMDNTF